MRGTDRSIWFWPLIVNKAVEFWRSSIDKYDLLIVRVRFQFYLYSILVEYYCTITICIDTYLNLGSIQCISTPNFTPWSGPIEIGHISFFVCPIETVYIHLW